MPVVFIESARYPIINNLSQSNMYFIHNIGGIVPVNTGEIQVICVYMRSVVFFLCSGDPFMQDRTERH